MTSSDPHRSEPESTPVSKASSSASVQVESASALLEAAIEPVVETMGYELVHLEWASADGNRRIRIYVDHPEGVGLDDCARLSPIVSNALDAAENDPDARGLASLLAQSYVLEVSSPGLDRPLSRRRQFERFVGRRATIRTTAPIEPESRQKTFHVELHGVEVDPDAPDDQHRGTLVVRVPDDGSIHRIPLDLVRRANLVPQIDDETGSSTGYGRS
jgi:ribosome maturation factor RimP